MRKMMCIGAIIAVFMLLMPLTALPKAANIPNGSIEVLAPINKEKAEKDLFRVFDSESNTITEMKAEDYIFCVVAAEMPAFYEEEALKAQAVASYTYAYCKRQQNTHKDYDITTDYSTDQSFKTKEQAILDWGEKGEEYATKIQSAVKSVCGELITYKNEPIMAVYHAISSGQTYAAEDIWGKEVKYLKSVSSSGDKLAEKYITQIEFSENELSEKLGELAEKKTDDTPVLGECNQKRNGLVENITIYGKRIKGDEVRTALDLPSTNFDFEKQNGKYVFTCRGCGHGVGMSQNGANYMAKQGYDYKQILKHYYKDTEIQK